MGIVLNSRMLCYCKILVIVKIIALLIVGGTIGCGGVIIGDPSHEVYWVNKSDIPVMIYKVSGPDKVYYARLAPGEKKLDAWLISKSTIAKRTVDAYDEAGTRVFCRQYNYQDLAETGWEIQIDRDQSGCN